jgi:peroxiredoxin
MTARVDIGDRVPQAVLAHVAGGELQPVALHDLLAGRRALIAGVPGAFTPVCTIKHIPDLLENAGRLAKGGYDLIACVVPDNPWAVAAWAAEIDPYGQLMFLSDGNLALARALGVTTPGFDYYMGETSARYLMVTESGIIRRFNVEKRFTDVTCTRADDAVMLD